MGVRFSVTELDTGKTIASTWNLGETDCWFTVEPVIAEWFSVSTDDVGIESDEEGHGDFVTVNGKRVGEIHVRFDRPERVSERRAA